MKRGCAGYFLDPSIRGDIRFATARATPRPAGVFIAENEEKNNSKGWWVGAEDKTRGVLPEVGVRNIQYYGGAKHRSK